MTPMVPALRSLNTRVTLSTLAIFLASLWSLSFYASQMLRKDMEQLLGEQQFSTVSMLADSINADVNDRWGALTTVAKTIGPALLGNAAAMQAFLDERPLLQSHFNGGVIAHRMDGTAIAEVPASAGRIGLNYMDVDTVAAALKEGKSTIGRPVMGRKLQAPVFGMTVPIRDAQGKVIGALAGVTNLGVPGFLNAIMDSRYGKNGGYMLVMPQHRMHVIATDQRLTMKELPAPGINPLMDRFIQGYEGSGVTTNALGVEVLVSAKTVPLAGWYVAAALPAAEAFAPIGAVQRRMLLATVLLTFLAGGLTWWMLRRQLAPMLTAATTLATMSDSDRPPRPLAIARRDEIGQLIGAFNGLLETLGQREEALKQSEAQNRALISAIPDLIFTNRRDGEYLAVHATDPGTLLASPETFLHRKVEEVLPMRVANLFMKAFADAVDSNSMVELNYSLTVGGKERQFEARVVPSVEDTVISIVREITGRRAAEQELRIAATAFECQEGMIITDANRIILRTNQSFTRIMGYSNEEVVGKTTTFMRSDRLPAAFFDAAWETAQRDGSWQAEVWHKRKNGEVFPQWLTSTAVKDEHGSITHYVVTHIDITRQKQQEAKRRADEAAHRDTLVREVHHRIKNNLQGITGLLRQFAQKHPETASPMNQAIGQVQGISVIHGLQGRDDPSSVRLCELTGAIAADVQVLWQTPVVLDIPPAWIPCVIAGNEAVPIALVINELMVNAVKHGGKASGQVRITLRKGVEQDMLEITITNRGQLIPDDMQADRPHSGLQLIAALMPRHGARLVREQHGDQVMTLLALGPPVVFPHLKEPT
ncbi:PAS domain S-box protein [Rhodoferax sp.]|uniref:PAS domain S-box protein n=1 Tax=Rhodoferax sp. TaxID=50421 RepID=UPI0027193081|nr:PAS domain S-box protein [Rhodoferax sp.]MDO9195193.1 PAS domain S-box protein [Rhodoferax sp.]